MASATITNAFQQFLVDQLIDSLDTIGSSIFDSDTQSNIVQPVLVGDSDRYYIAVGRSDDWVGDDVDNASGSLAKQRELRVRLQSVKRIAEAQTVAPRVNWSANTIYYAWDDLRQTNDDGFPFYVITEENQVYVCMQQGKDASGNAVVSTVEPTGVKGKAFSTADGYVWKYLYTVGAADATKFLSANWMPVLYYPPGFVAVTAAEKCGLASRDSAVAGSLVGIAIENGGSGYTSAPTVSIAGNGSGASATAYIDGGSVVKIEMDSDGEIPIDNIGFAYGSDYDYAVVNISGGSPDSAATARAIIAPREGIGYNPRNDLLAGGIMFNVKPSGDENGNWITDNDFRQIAVWLNPNRPAGWPTLDSAGVTNLDVGSANCLAGLKFDLAGQVDDVPTPDDIITGQTSSATAFVDTVDSDIVYYHQTDSTGYGSFISGETVTYVGNSMTLTDSAHIAPEVDVFSGDILYIDNRDAIPRDTESTEDMKIVIVF